MTETEASLSVMVVCSAGEIGKEMKMSERNDYEDTIVLTQDLRKTEGPHARVTISRSTSVSDSAQWGKGTFDKINYKVEVFASVTLECDQDNTTIRTAQNVAYALAWEASRRHLQHAVVSHDDAIRNVIYTGYFGGE